MASPYLGGLRIIGAAWISPTSLRVAYASTWAGLLYQLYAGRRLIGVTESSTARSVAGPLDAGDAPEHIAIVAVGPADRLTDFGRQLPIRPYNRVRLTFAASGWPADAEFLDVRSGTVAGGAVDPTNRIDRLLYDDDGDYESITPPLAESGTWHFEVVGRDERPPDGNVGSPLALSAAVLCYPEDVALQSDGTRLTASAAAGVLNVTCTL